MLLVEFDGFLKGRPSGQDATSKGAEIFLLSHTTFIVCISEIKKKSFKHNTDHSLFDIVIAQDATSLEA